MAQSYPSWMYAFLKELNIKPNASNLYFLSLWTASEGTAGSLIDGRTGKMTAVNNPLAITDPQGNWSRWETGSWNSVGVKQFDTPEHGGIAAAQFLKNDTANTNGYLSIIAALKKNSLVDQWRAVNRSRWCYGCGGGKYPTAVYAALGSRAPAVGPPLATRPIAKPIPAPLSSSGGGGNKTPVASGAQGAQATTTASDSSGAQGFQGVTGPQGAQGADTGPKGDAKAVSCKDRPDLINLGFGIGPSLKLTACNAKAITAGMVTILGTSALMVGAILLGVGFVAKTPAGKAAMNAAETIATRGLKTKAPKPTASIKPPKGYRPRTAAPVTPGYEDLPAPPVGYRGRVAPPDAPAPNKYGER